MKQGPFVNFRLPPQMKRRTKLWHVESIRGGNLFGYVCWAPTLKRYVFEPEDQTVYDANMLWDIADFCAKMTKEQQENAKKRRAAR